MRSITASAGCVTQVPPASSTARFTESIAAWSRRGSSIVEWIWAGTPAGQVIPIVSRGRAPPAITTPETGRLAATNSAIPAPFEKPIATNPSGRSATPWMALVINSGKPTSSTKATASS